MPRVNFVSFTFLFAFGLGSFVGIAMALLAVALATPEPEPTFIEVPAAGAAADAATLTPTTVATAAPTVTPTPVPAVRTRSTLNVRIGPDDRYAVLGTLAGGSEIAVQGRDTGSDWVAIDFPPGSSARGWIPAGQVEGLSLVQISSLGVLQASVIDTSPRSTATRTPAGFDGGPNAGPGATRTPPALQDDPTPRVGTPTPTSTPSSIGPSDLAITGVTSVSGGLIRFGIENLGPGAVPQFSVEVSAAGYADETLTVPVVMRAGDTVTLQTSELQINGPALVVVTIDPDGELADIDRSNNTLRLDLEP
jgi:hypothetical protein